MQNPPLLKTIIQKTKSFNFIEKSRLANYTIVILFSLIINKKSIAQSYSLSTTGAIPDSSAMLDIISSNKGLLIPRVSLTSTVDSATIPHPAISLQVYNTNTSMTGGGIGFWYWDGTKWVRNISSVGADSLVVGSSTSNHSYNLQVTGTAGVTTSLTTPLIVGGSNSTDSLVYKTTTSNGTSGADHIFLVGTNGGTEAMRILNNGNIGIGTNDPQRQLHLNSANPTIGFSEFDGGANAKNWLLYSNSETFVLSTRADNWNHLDYVLAAQRNGNIGIGTITPDIYSLGVSTYKHLTVSAPTAGTNYAILTLAGGSSGGGTLQYGNQTIRQAAINTSSSSDLLFQTNTTNSGTTLSEKMRILANGKVGIGTSSPSALIHGIKTTEQLRLGYDASNYYSTTVSSSGAVTFDATGSGAAFTFSDAVSLANNSTASTQALNDSTTKVATTAFVDRALAGVSGGSGWGLTGNSGTTDGTHFIGTTDNKPFNIKVNNQKAARIDNANGNVFFGYQSGNGNTSGTQNSSYGQQALYSNTSGGYNIAVGSQAMYYHGVNGRNVAIGYTALRGSTTYSNNTGSSNVALGYEAMFSNTSGSSNQAIGDAALYSSTTGAYNQAIGTTSMVLNTTGSYNVAIGNSTMYSNTTGSENVSVGYSALSGNSTGSYNIAIGPSALSGTTSISNTAIGYQAGSANTTGNYNTYLGFATTGGANNLTNSTAVGSYASVSASNKVRIGNSSVTVIEGQVSFTSVSDGRFKKNIVTTDIKGLDFIMKLRPVSYNIDTKQYEEFVTKKLPDSVKIKHFKGRDFSKSTAIRHIGFIAQEVEQAAQSSNFEFSGLHKPESEDDNYGLAYSEFVVPIIKAMQEQQKIIELQNSKIEKLEIELQQIRNKTK